MNLLDKLPGVCMHEHCLERKAIDNVHLDKKNTKKMQGYHHKLWINRNRWNIIVRNQCFKTNQNLYCVVCCGNMMFSYCENCIELNKWFPLKLELLKSSNWKKIERENFQIFRPCERSLAINTIAVTKHVRAERIKENFLNWIYT